MRLDVGSGSYAFRCLFDDYDPMTGPTVVVGGHASGTPAILPITNADLLAPASEYHAYVAAGLNTLVSRVNVLAADVRAGHLDAARTAWLPAHQRRELRQPVRAGRRARLPRQAALHAADPQPEHGRARPVLPVTRPRGKEQQARCSVREIRF